jgi:nitrate/nitrite-specific signal transduction histidine kinase
MHERAELMGAELAVHTAPHQGAEVRLVVPLAASALNAVGSRAADLEP